MFYPAFPQCPSNALTANHFWSQRGLGQHQTRQGALLPQGSPHRRAGMAPGPTGTTLTLARAERFRAAPGPMLLICPVASSGKTTSVQDNWGLRRVNNYVENVNGSFVCLVLLIMASLPLARTVPWQRHPVQLANINIAVCVSKNSNLVAQSCSKPTNRLN